MEHAQYYARIALLRLFLASYTLIVPAVNVEGYPCRTMYQGNPIKAHWDTIGRILSTACLTYACWVILHTNLWVLTDEHLFAFLLSAFFLALHEAGHMLFLLPKLFLGTLEAGHFLYVAGGSIFQWLFPLCLAIYFYIRRQFFSIAVCLFLFGNSLLNSVLYIGDAMALQLPLLGGENAGAHDWNYLLHYMGILYKAPEIADGFEVVAHNIMLFSVVWCWILSINSVVQMRGVSSNNAAA